MLIAFWIIFVLVSAQTDQQMIPPRKAIDEMSFRPGRGDCRHLWVAETTPAKLARAVEAGAARPDSDQGVQRSLMPE
jgi:hypothetical protein